MRAQVIGIGQVLRGDDGVGLAVVDELERRALPDVELVRVREPSQVVDLVTRASLTVLVDALVAQARAPGSVMVIDPEQLDGRAQVGVSTHGISVAQAIELGRVLHPAAESVRFLLVAVGITVPTAYGRGMSPAVLGAVPRAADAVERLLEET